MADEPFISMPVINPACIRSLITGPSPTLMTCPPSPQMIGLFDERAYKTARMRARRSFPARICGSLDINPSTFSDPSIGFPKIPVCTLLLRSRSGYVETPLKFRGLVEYSESTVNPWDKFRGRARDRRAHKGYDRARRAFLGCEVFRGLERETKLRRDPSIFRPSLR